MFVVKVKTLDGRTQEYSVPDDATVLQFKELVQEKTEIPVERQRLLYQGRVLPDEPLLNSYDVAGNVMHLVTRLPPPPRVAEETLADSDDNSDVNRDQLRNIISDVFGNMGDTNNPVGVTVNNEGNRMDITVNLPTQNRLSLSRLRQNYVMRLLNQARNVINHMENPSSTEPRSDRERMRQADPYDIGPDDEMLTEVTSQPLPISNLADMIAMTRALWRSAEPQLELWESVLRRENGPNSVPRTDIEMQRMHDASSRYVHLFSHVLHILSDYLVEFQPSAITRATASRTTAESAATGASSDTGMDHDDTATVTTDAPAEIDDRSRYLYVFSEMPAQLVQVRLDVDSTIHELRPTTTTAPTATATATPTVTTSTPVTQPSATMPPPRTTESTRPTATATATPSPSVPTNDDRTDPRTRNRRRFMASSNMADNLLRSTLHSALHGPSVRPTMPSGARPLRTTSQLTETIDPYLRCQSRHFQNPAHLRSGAVISTFSGIRLRENPRPRVRPTIRFANGGVVQMNTTTPTNPVSDSRPQQGSETDPMQSILSGLMNSIFSGSTGDILRSTSPGLTSTIPIPPSRRRVPVQTAVNPPVRLQGSSLSAPLSAIFPEMLNNTESDSDNFITNRIINIVINQLTLMDFFSIVRGQYNALNRLRVPLQEILQNHQQSVGSRDTLIDHVVSDMEYFNRAYVSVFELLRSGNPVANLSDEARNSFNIRLDIFQSMNNLNRHHFHSMIDMIMRSPTNQGFGQLLMNGMISHHSESLALIDIICNGNEELRQFLIKSLLDSLVSSMNQTNGGESGRGPVSFDMLFGDINSSLFRQPDQLSALREHTMNNFVVYLATDSDDATSTAAIVPMDDLDGPEHSIDQMVISLSENVSNGAMPAETETRVPVMGCLDNGSTTPAVHHQGPGWQTVVPEDWIQVMAQDTDMVPAAVMIAEDGSQHTVPYSDAYLAGMPAKRRKVIVSQRQRSVRPAADMMHDCIDQAIRSAGLPTDPSNVPTVTAATVLTDAFQDMVTERIGHRLSGATEDGALNFVPDRFPTAEHNFVNRKKRTDDTNNNPAAAKKNN